MLDIFYQQLCMVMEGFCRIYFLKDGTRIPFLKQLESIPLKVFSYMPSYYMYTLKTKVFHDI